MHGSLAPACLEDRGQPALVAVEEFDDRLAHRLWQGPVLGGEHAAEAHALLSQHVEIERDVALEPGRVVGARGVHGVESDGESCGVSGDEGGAQVGLAGKVVVQGRPGHTQLGGDVGVAEPVEAPVLDEPFTGVEDQSGGGRFVPKASVGHGPRSLTLTY